MLESIVFVSAIKDMASDGIDISHIMAEIG